MAKDPLKIIGKPDPTPEERAAAEALSAETGRPARTCRAALLEASHDVARAKALLNDGKFLLWNTETDDVDMMWLAHRLMREQSGAPPPPDPFAGVDWEAVRKDGEAFLKANPTREPHEVRVARARGTKLKDPVFGALKWNTFWDGRANVPAFGKMPLSVETDREPWDIATPPTDAHRAAFQQFLAAAVDVHAKVENANVEYLERVREVYEEDGEKLPRPKTPAGLWRHLKSATLHIPLQDGKAWRVILTWACSWDQEHGHAVYIEGGEVVNVCIQGEGWPD